jgi:hypothetical protein
MRLFELLIEGYKEAQLEFTNASDPESAQDAINAYKQLVTKNQVQGNERNIDWWRKQGWNAFNKFVTTKATQPTKSDVKRKRIPGKSITLQEDDTWLIVIPVDKEASCFHGKNSDWCTTKTNQSHFEQYFYNKQVTLIYCLNKLNAGMWAIAYHNDIDQIELFDQKDKSLDEPEFRAQTGLSVSTLLELAKTDDNTKTLDTARGAYKDQVGRLKELMMDFDGTSKNPEIEKLLIYTKSARYSDNYISRIGSKNGRQTFPDDIVLAAIPRTDDVLQWVKDPSEKVQLAAVEDYPASIEYLENPSEKVQLATVKKNGANLVYITDPSDEVMRVAITHTPAVIEHFEHPAEHLQLIAINENPRNIQYIENSTEKVQLIAVNAKGHYIEFISNPTEKVQLAAIQDNPRNIHHITKPTENAQLAAVNRNGNTIDGIANPSPKVQIAAVKNDPLAIRRISDPTIEAQIHAVTQYPRLIRGIKNPTERIQLISVSTDPSTLQYIANPTERVTQLAYKITHKLNPT